MNYTKTEMTEHIRRMQAAAACIFSGNYTEYDRMDFMDYIDMFYAGQGLWTELSNRHASSL